MPVGQEAAAVSSLQADEQVDFVGLHRKLATIADTPLDPYWGQQWGMAKVQGPAGWDLGWGAPRVAIAVVDTGVQQQQLDLRSQTWYNPGESALDANGRRTCDTAVGVQRRG